MGKRAVRGKASYPSRAVGLQNRRALVVLPFAGGSRVTKFSLFWIFWMITGNPLVAIVVLLVGFWALDRFALGLMPPWMKAWARFGEVSRLRFLVGSNPHDRPSRRALAELYVARRQYARAAEVMEPILAHDRGRPESGALLVAAEAYLGKGDLERAGDCIEAAHEGARTTQYFELALLTGRILQASGRLLEAVEAYEEAISLSQGRVEPRVRLARVLKTIERREDALRARKDAWRVYTEAPFFQQRRERLWAWRANPTRPFTYGALVFAFSIFLAVIVRPHLAQRRAVDVPAARTLPGHGNPDRP